MKKRGLGRGLGALIPTSADEESEARANSVEVDIDQITPNPHQPRHGMDPDKLQELADSISKHGLIQPLVVTKIGSTYQLIAGERRWRASKLAGLDSVSVIVKDVSPQEMVELALVENIQRADLNPLEEAMAYAQLVSDFGLTQEQVAERVGKSRVAVTNTIRLLNLTDEAKDALTSGKITAGHAKALLKLKSEHLQRQALTAVITQELNVRQTEALTERLRQSESPTSLAPPPPPVKPSESINSLDKTMLQMFESVLGTKVELTRTEKDKGRLVIHFFSQEELQAIFDTILGEEQQM